MRHCHCSKRMHPLDASLYIHPMLHYYIYKMLTMVCKYDLKFLNNSLFIINLAIFIILFVIYYCNATTRFIGMVNNTIYIIPESILISLSLLGFLNSSGGWCALTSGLGGQLFTWCLTTSRFASGLLGTCHGVQCSIAISVDTELTYLYHFVYGNVWIGN